MAISKAESSFRAGVKDQLEIRNFQGVEELFLRYGYYLELVGEGFQVGANRYFMYPLPPRDSKKVSEQLARQYE